MLCALVLVLVMAEVSPIETSFRVVVHPSNPITSITRAELSAIYMKRTRSWRDRSEIVPIEQPSTSRLREQFSRVIHGKSVAYVTRYWQRVIFAGRGLPPAEAKNSAAVIDLVRTNRAAIGYIDAQTPLPEGVKVIAVRP